MAKHKARKKLGKSSGKRSHVVSTNRRDSDSDSDSDFSFIISLVFGTAFCMLIAFILNRINEVSLYVGDLHPSVTEGNLHDAFSEFRSFTSVRLCKDVSTGRSLCYGYANFLSRDEANLAIEKKNQSMLNGKMIRVMWPVREPDASEDGAGNVLVKNLPDSINNATGLQDREPDAREDGAGNVLVKNLPDSINNAIALQDMFMNFGKNVSYKVATSEFESGKSLGFGFVQYEQQDAAHAAIENLIGTIVNDREIYVGNFMIKTDQAIRAEVEYTNLYMKDLLREKVWEFGKIVSLAIAKDETKSCKGFAFVNAKRATEALNGSKSLYVGRAQKKAEREKLLKEQFEKKCTEQKMIAKVSNIDVGVTEEELRQHFSQCGTITSAKIMCDEKGISKGFGFVCFSTPEEAVDAVKTHNGHMFHGKPLYVAIAKKEEDRKM